jgi:hypothetical protein
MDAKTVEKKLNIAVGLFQMAYEMKKYQLKKKYPQMSEKELNHKTYKMIQNGCK